MKRFARLFIALDATTKTAEKIAALSDYFKEAAPADAAWAVYLLAGRKIPQIIPTRRLSAWAAEAAEISDWMMGESYDAVGDLAETIALLLPEPLEESEGSLAYWVEDRLEPLRGVSELVQRSAMLAAWRELSHVQRFLMHKMITGAFRVGVSQRLVVRGLAQASGITADVLEHRLMGDWRPSEEFFQGLVSPDIGDAGISRPYPFLLAHPLEQPLETLGDINEWQLEWKWDGIRAQIVRRGGKAFLWSRGEELITDRFPELHASFERLPEGIVMDGEVVAWRDGRALDFAILQRRIGRKNLTRKILHDAPVVFLAFDLLEHEGHDNRPSPLVTRRASLERLLAALDMNQAPLLPAPLVVAANWNEATALRAESRTRRTEGLMLKRLNSAYGVGRPKGDWWKWKIEPYTVDAVLVYAQRGSGKRASLFTDYTFAVWDGAELVPFAKAYSGLTDEEIREVDRFIRENTVERHGPVRSVKPELVFELAFESIQRSNRHRSGVAVRFPRIARRRMDKRPQDADSLDRIQALVKEVPRPAHTRPEDPRVRYLWDDNEE